MANSHKRDTNARRFPRAAVLAAPIALLVTAPAVAWGVLASAPPSSDHVVAPVATAALSLSDLRAGRDSVSRAGSRYAESSESRGEQYVLSQQSAFARRQTLEATQRAVEQADTRLWTTAPLNTRARATTSCSSARRSRSRATSTSSRLPNTA